MVLICWFVFVDVVQMLWSVFSAAASVYSVDVVASH